ncbi:acetate/propionate family kinase [Celeribacter arenosi]|uniref:Acetate kinase n=1 Tax=Celeribacter arenosi TaxID=792649 RepID=A0ABP7K163_9RHOB
MSEVILTLNAGSSSMKFAAYRSAADAPERIMRGQVAGLGTEPTLVLKTGGQNETRAISAGTHAEAMPVILDAIAPFIDGARVVGVGHRIVHGGPDVATHRRLDAALMEELAGYEPLAPLHQPHNLAAARAAMEVFPDAVQVGCFDTAFHRTHGWVNDAFAIPRKYYDRGVRRYGFHGLSYDYITRRLATDYPTLAGRRIVIAHLGNGASMCGVRDGKSVATTMGFSPLDGLPMGTRSGQIDPGVLLYLMETECMDAKELAQMLYRESGLLGLSGISNDMRTLLASHDPHAAQAVDYFVFRVRREIGAMSAVLGGIDGVVFCGGIGENAPVIRGRVLDGLQYLGIEVDAGANDHNAVEIGRGAVPVLVIPTDEEFVIADAVQDTLRSYD